MRFHLLGVLVVVAAVICPVAGDMELVPLENRIAGADVIVSGRICDISDDIEDPKKLAGKYVTYYRIAYIEVEEVLKNDLADLSVKPGDKLPFATGPTARRAKANHKKLMKAGLIADVGVTWTINKGDEGIWILSQSGRDLVVWWRDNLLSTGELNTVKKALSKLESDYQLALKSTIPLYEAGRREILSTPAFPGSKTDAAMGKPIPADVNLSDVYVVKYGSMQSLFIMKDTGAVLGGMPYYPLWLAFHEGRLLVATKCDKTYGDCRYIDRNGQLLSDTVGPNPWGTAGPSQLDDSLKPVERSVWVERSAYAPSARLSEKAPKHMLFKRWGYANEQGEMVIPPLFDSAGPFENGLAHISVRQFHGPYDLAFRGLINETGKVVFVVSNPTAR